MLFLRVLWRPHELARRLQYQPWATAPLRNAGSRAGQQDPVPQRVSFAASLAVLAPEVAAQWHPSKNGDVTPSQVMSKSNKKYWWKCEAGPDHEYEASPNHRVGSNTGCPFCSGRKVSATNSLAAVAPDVAAQWHPSKNGDVTPSQVMSQSHKKCWWICNYGHEYEANPNCRVGQNSGCPFCSGRTRPVLTTA